MKDDDSYLTVSGVSEGLYKDRGSKFISFVHPVSSESQAKSLILTYKKAHKGARHHCYAYKTGVSPSHYRTNDDGEPSGTAGKPIYGQIQSNNITNVLIVVVRYFGGTLLGTGGLIAAYKNAAANALKNARIVKRSLKHIYSVKYHYENTNEMNRLMAQFDAQVLKSDYTEKCEQKIAVRQSLAETFYNQIYAMEDTDIELISND